EVDRLDAVRIALRVARALRAPDGVGRLRAELGLERVEEALEEIEHERVGAAHRLADRRVYQRRERDRPQPRGPGGAVDALNARPGLLDRVHEGDGLVGRFDTVELGKQAVTEHLDRDTGAVRDEEHGWAAIEHEM